MPPSVGSPRWPFPYVGATAPMCRLIDLLQAHALKRTGFTFTARWADSPPLPRRAVRSAIRASGRCAASRRGQSMERLEQPGRTRRPLRLAEPLAVPSSDLVAQPDAPDTQLG